jgi:hypothetical protein
VSETVELFLPSAFATVAVSWYVLVLGSVDPVPKSTIACTPAAHCPDVPVCESEKNCEFEHAVGLVVGQTPSTMGTVVTVVPAL